MKIDKSDAEKVLEFLTDAELCRDTAIIYTLALKQTGNECKNQWTNKDLINEILLAYEKVYTAE